MPLKKGQPSMCTFDDVLHTKTPSAVLQNTRVTTAQKGRVIFIDTSIDERSIPHGVTLSRGIKKQDLSNQLL